jgi:hypothetical protein
VTLFTHQTYSNINASSKCEGFLAAFISLLLYLSLLKVPALKMSQKLRQTNLPQSTAQTLQGLHNATPRSITTVAEQAVCYGAVNIAWQCQYLESQRFTPSRMLHSLD